jgi:hypothetical protein
MDTVQNYDSYINIQSSKTYELKKSVAGVRKRTVPTERPPHIGEVTVNFCG